MKGRPFGESFVSNIESIARSVMHKYATAVYERDVAAFINLYTGNVRIFDAWDAWEYRGATQWQHPISAWLTSHVSEKLTVTFDQMAVHGSESCVAVTALVTYARASAEGTVLGAIQNRLTWVLKIHRDIVQIVHEHTSVPVDFQEMKALTMQHSHAQNQDIHGG